MSYDLNCPYCDAQLNVCHDDGFGYQEGVNHEMQCEKCDKNFVFQTSISFYYEPEKADCLNGEPHELKISSTHPNAFSTMDCQHCDFTRELTEDERLQHGIPTKHEYFESLKNSQP